MVKRVAIGVGIGLLCLIIPYAARGEAMLDVFDGTQTLPMPREKYLTCVVAAEMPALYEAEALKAQAVAARTRVVGKSCQRCPQADVCIDSACCQGYLDEAGQRARWGADYELYHEKISQAVRDTAGLILTYNGEPIEVLYHAASGGFTEDVEQVYATALPYLRGVPSPGEEGASGYETVQTFPMAALVALFPEEAEGDAVALEILARSESGRVTQVRVGRHTMTGRTFRTALALKSTNFSFFWDGDALVVRQLGHGHGVGMSQAGANAMAQQGATFDQILLHYYTGVNLTRLAD
ncbi:MAG: stage II sporulation protein D [Oscillospiraceae bacterium]|jgi:stage II sporulation protein D|nr:stage II sporulation protein D [Oscillospiraceae bacterium]